VQNGVGIHSFVTMASTAPKIFSDERIWLTVNLKRPLSFQCEFPTIGHLRSALAAPRE
jgi:hypothetical protein